MYTLLNLYFYTIELDNNNHFLDHIIIYYNIYKLLLRVCILTMYLVN